ncbi:MAG: phenylalanine--tRNA ligase subunit beta [Pyrinomonadaceae bacterium]
MNISYNWLRDLIDIDLPPSELGKRLTDVGLAVEGIHEHGEDSVFDIDLTSNRPDCLSHLGVAREIGVITEHKLTAETQEIGEIESEIPMPAVLAGDVVRIDETELCQRFTARIIRNVKIGPSPQWMVDRLEAIGERSINNVADITNYVMHELGQPMHSFDLDKLDGNRIVVRVAREGETIKTLDEVDRNLTTDMLVICDAEKPVAIAGIMGGLDSSISESTSNVLLEVAHFKRENIRATSRKLNLNTEASYRFERGVDIENLIGASNRAAQLICELAGGEMGELIDMHPSHPTPVSVESSNISAAVKRLTGLDVATDECVRILTALGIMPQDRSEISDLKSQIFASPSWRHDIHIEEDLVEEIARHAGYDNIANELPPAYGAGEYQPTESREKVLRQTLTDHGFDEALSYGFIDTKHDGVFEIVPGLLANDLEDKYVTLNDSVMEGAVRMRATSLPGLLDAIRLNFNHQRKDVRLFEIGKAYAATVAEDHAPNEQKLLSLVITGAETVEGRAMPVREFDFYDAKGAVEAALQAIGVSDAEYVPTDVTHLRRGQSASISIDGSNIGHVGRLSDDIAGSYKFKQSIYVAELNLQTALTKHIETPTYRPLAKYPSVTRDVSFVVKRDMTFASICEIIRTSDATLCRNVMFVDIYEGKGMAEDERSITIRLEYSNDARTLVEEEVEAEHQSILELLDTELGIRPRF